MLKRLFLVALWVLPFVASAEQLAADLTNPGYVEKPVWFKNSFLDLRDDVAEASENNRRVLLYFYQDGCPYCEKLIKDNFSLAPIVSKTRHHFDTIAINMWGDREVIDIEGKESSEKAFSKNLRVQFTPTILMLNEEGKVVLRVNGYYHPQKFEMALDYVGKKMESVLSFRDYRKQSRINAKKALNNKDINLKALLKNQKPLLVIVEEANCKPCLEYQNDIAKRQETIKRLDQLNVVSLDMWSKKKMIDTKGRETTVADWAAALDVKYAPGFVFFDQSGNEVFRTEGYLRAFHAQSAMDYVIDSIYKTEPEFQRFIEHKADNMRLKGLKVDIWE